jgi:hypothetical protein
MNIIRWSRTDGHGGGAGGELDEFETKNINRAARDAHLMSGSTSHISLINCRKGGGVGGGKLVVVTLVVVIPTYISYHDHLLHIIQHAGYF